MEWIHYYFNGDYDDDEAIQYNFDTTTIDSIIYHLLIYLV